MSTHQEIMEVYAGDIVDMATQVEGRFGRGVLYEGLIGIGHVWPDEFIELAESVRVADIDPALDRA